MNKIKGFVIMIIMVLSVVFVPVTTVSANTTEVSQKYLEFTVSVPDSFKSNEIEASFKIKNINTNKEYCVNVMYDSLNCRFVADYGSYELVEGSFFIGRYKSMLALEQYEVTMQPFVVNDSMDGCVNVKILTKGGSMLDSGSSTSASQSTNATTNSNENSGNTLTLPADNKYFPNMTLTEIKKWYLDECNKFVATGKKNAGNQFYDVEYFKQCVENYSDYSFNKKEKRMLSMYMTIVDGYNKSDTQEFYQVQKKLYDFIKDYHANNEYMLNFSNWDKVNQLPTEAPTEAPSSSEVSTQTPSQQVTEPTVESTEASTTTADSEDGKSWFDVFKGAWITIILLVVVVIVGIVIKIKYNKSDDI